jgi:Fe-S oxidoreductase
MEPETREVFYSLPLWLAVTFYVVAVGALGVFAWGVGRRVRRSREGRPESAPSLRRFGRAVLTVMSNRSVGRRNLYAGVAHAATFWGFAGLFVATILVLIDNDILHPLIPEWTFIKGDFYLVFSWLADLSGVLLIVGLAMFAFRRGALRPPELQAADRTDAELPPRASMLRDDWVFLTLLFLAGIGGFVVEALRIRATQPSFEGWSFTGWLVSGWFGDAGVSAAGADSVFAYFWVFHALTAVVFIAYLPHSKAYHMLAGWWTLAAQPESVGRVPPTVDTESGGYGYLTDLSRNELIGLDACIRCGRCHVACPAAMAGMPLSPRDLVLAMRSGVERLLPAPRPAPGTAATRAALAGEIVPASWVWGCTTCGACDEVCPLGVQHLPLLLQMRRHLVAAGDLEQGVQDALMNVMRYGNSFGTSPRARAKWTKELDFEIPDARKQHVEYLWFVGDYASYDPRVQTITRATARVLQHAGVDVGILHAAEQNAGTDVRRLGEEGLFEMQRDRNLESLEGADFDKLVTTDPHSYFALRSEYGNGNGSGPPFPVLHYTELLDRLIDEGTLAVERRGVGSVTYHDPCYLGRYGGVFEPPRRVIRALGYDLIEMPRNRATALCCGAGGGRIWMEDAPGGGERPAEIRVREAAGLAGVDTLVVTCPKDLVMLQDALKTTGLEERIVVRDIIELVEEASLDIARSALS